ncbi:MAG: twin-arginine translocase TatA/TatE family subunit [Micrococcales bacterium]|nr:twin-arginine translocase TatA/TatE family subunit [Micrococcales bacterium]MCL2666797.1 twin-arginine translocase TatA/TatE family subunit [Micrococcales bacterium]
MGRFAANPALIVILVLIIIIVFGANKLPVAAKSLGQSLRIFKNELRADDEKKDEPTDAPSDSDNVS